MTGSEVKNIRKALSNVLNRRLSQRDLGLALGLSEGNADHAIREWESDGPSGPGAVALRLMSLATDLGPTDLIFRQSMLTFVRTYFPQ